jgi:multiple sugar transport system ATP-binding protein
MNMPARVEIKGLGVSFGGNKVLQGLDLDIRESEFLVLLGSSGCGKSTLLNAIAGLVDVEDGEIWIGGRDVTWAEPKDRGIAMVFQSYALYPRMNVRENMTFGSRVAGVPAPEIATRLQHAAKMLKLEALLDRKPAELSGGQRQRVAIGRAIVRQSGVFLFDEPLSNLDAQLRSELRVEIKRLHRRLNATMIYVTHDQIEAMTLADRVAVMQNGVIQQLDTPEMVYREPANRFVASFVGSPSMNFIDGRISRTEETVVFDAAGLSVRIDGYPFRDWIADRTAVLGIRPEHILAGKDVGDDPTFVSVDMLDRMGADTLVWCCTEGGVPFRFRMNGLSDLPGLIPVSFPVTAISLFDAETGARL